MTWHLKDRELEKKLNEISGGDFSEQLNEVKNLASYKEGLYLAFGNKCLNKGFLHKVGDFRKYKIFIEYNELEEVPEYNPHAWNEYPAVTPPEGIPMRVEIDTLTDEVRRDCAIFKNGRWFSEFGGKANYKIAGPVRRYRPWSDD